MVLGTPGIRFPQGQMSGVSAFIDLGNNMTDDDQYSSLTHSASDSRRTSAADYDSQLDGHDDGQVHNEVTFDKKLKPNDARLSTVRDNHKQSEPDFRHFTMVTNAPGVGVRDNRLSAEAKLAYFYIMTKHDFWRAQPQDFKNNLGFGETVYDRTLAELEDHRYMRRDDSVVDEYGHKVYPQTWYESPYPRWIPLPERRQKARRRKGLNPDPDFVPRAKPDVTVDSTVWDATPETVAIAKPDVTVDSAPLERPDIVSTESLSLTQDHQIPQGARSAHQVLIGVQSSRVDSTVRADESAVSTSATTGIPEVIPESGTPEKPLEKKSEYEHTDARAMYMCRLGRCDKPEDHQAQNDNPNRVSLMALLAKGGSVTRPTKAPEPPPELGSAFCCQTYAACPHKAG